MKINKFSSACLYAVFILIIFCASVLLLSCSANGSAAKRTEKTENPEKPICVIKDGIAGDCYKIFKYYHS